MTVLKKHQLNVKIAASEQILAYKHVFLDKIVNFNINWWFLEFPNKVWSCLCNVISVKKNIFQKLYS